MAREQANINTAIWGDRDWRQLTSPAKYLYMLLLTHPSITYAGVVDWRAAKLSLLSPDTTKEGLEESARELQRARFIFIDYESEEVMIRSYLRHDGILKQPKLSVSMVNAYASTASHKIQDVVAFELHRLHKEYPEWAAWRSTKVQEVLKNKGANMDSFTLNAGQALPKAEASVCPSVTLNAGQGQGLHTTTATTTATSTEVLKETSPDKSDAGAHRDDVQEIIDYFSEALTANDVKHHTSPEWFKEARLLIDKDGYTVEQIKAVINFTTNSDFWKANVLSLPKLRKKFETLKLQSRSKTSTKQTSMDRLRQTSDLGHRLQQEEDQQLAIRE